MTMRRLVRGVPATAIVVLALSACRSAGAETGTWHDDYRRIGSNDVSNEKAEWKMVNFCAGFDNITNAPRNIGTGEVRSAAIYSLRLDDPAYPELFDTVGPQVCPESYDAFIGRLGVARLMDLPT